MPIMTLRGVYCTKNSSPLSQFSACICNYIFIWNCICVFSFSCFSWWDRAYSCRHPLCSLHWCYCWSPHQTLRSQNRISDIFSLHWSNNNANLLKVLHRCVRQKMIKIIPQGRKESWRLQVPQTGGPLWESFQGDLIFLNNAALGCINLDQLVPCTC